MIAAATTKLASSSIFRSRRHEILAALPNHDQLIPALCHYDLVGFQTEVDAANFSRYIANECGLPWASGNSFHFGNRVVQVGTFPVGVETEAFARLARRAVETHFRP